jgi:hypothetical protein
MKKLITYIIIILSSSNSFSQFEQMILPSDLKQETVITEPATLRKGFLRTSLFLSHSIIDKTFDDKGTKGYSFGLGGWGASSMYELSLMYGVTDRLMLGVDLPYLVDKFYIASETILPGYDSSIISHYNADGIGLSDLSLSIDYQILYKNEGKTSLKAQIYLTLPTGRSDPENVVSFNEYDKPTGYGNMSADYRLIYRKVIYPYSFSGYLSYKYNFKATKIHNPYEDPVEFKSGDMFYLGGSFNMHLNEWIALMNELSYSSWSNDEYYGTTSSDVELDGRYSLTYQPSLVFQIRRFRFFEVIHYPLKGKNTGADPGYVFGLQYTF